MSITSDSHAMLGDNTKIQTWLPPPDALGEKVKLNIRFLKKSFKFNIKKKLLQAVEYKPLEEKDLYGMKISKRALKNLSPAEIRDLVEVFQTFDRSHSG